MVEEFSVEKIMWYPDIEWTLNILGGWGEFLNRQTGDHQQLRYPSPPIMCGWHDSQGMLAWALEVKQPHVYNSETLP